MYVVKLIKKGILNRYSVFLEEGMIKWLFVYVFSVEFFYSRICSYVLFI